MMDVCERVGCTLQELPSRMSNEEYILWAARLTTTPETSPDRWYAQILAALLHKGPEWEKYLASKAHSETYLNSATSVEELQVAATSTAQQFKKIMAELFPK